MFGLFKGKESVEKSKIIELLNALNDKYSDNNQALAILLEIAVAFGIDVNDNGDFV